MAIETAEEFMQSLEPFHRVDSPWGQAVHMAKAAFEARDNAVRRELLAEMRAALGQYYEHAVGSALKELDKLDRKYAAKDLG